MTKAYFISDIHLDSPEDQRWGDCLEFLKNLSQANATHLFLVGDIFDLWVADHEYFKAKFKVFINEIKRLIDSGVEVHYFEGNHDLYLKKFWQETLQAYVHSGPEYFNLAGLNVRVEHGDEMDPEDKGYIFLRKFLRNPLIKLINIHLPEKLIVKIGESSSAKSRNYTSHVRTINKQQAKNKIRVHAKKVFTEKPFDLIISGHVHITDDYSLQQQGKKFRSINLGSWFDGPKIFLIEEDSQTFLEKT